MAGGSLNPPNKKRHQKKIKVNPQKITNSWHDLINIELLQFFTSIKNFACYCFLMLFSVTHYERLFSEKVLKQQF